MPVTPGKRPGRTLPGMWTGAGSTLRGRRVEWLVLAILGECAFASLVALVTGVPPAFEATVAFGLVVAFGLEIQDRRELAHARARWTHPPSERRPGDRA